jgi:hypothetical protein
MRCENETAQIILTADCFIVEKKKGYEETRLFEQLK